MTFVPVSIHEFCQYAVYAGFNMPHFVDQGFVLYLCSINLTFSCSIRQDSGLSRPQGSGLYLRLWDSDLYLWYLAGLGPASVIFGRTLNCICVIWQNSDLYLQ